MSIIESAVQLTMNCIVSISFVFLKMATSSSSTKNPLIYCWRNDSFDIEKLDSTTGIGVKVKTPES